MWFTVASRSAPGAAAEATATEPPASATAPTPATHQFLRNTLHLRVRETAAPSPTGVTLHRRRTDSNHLPRITRGGPPSLGQQRPATENQCDSTPPPHPFAPARVPLAQRQHRTVRPGGGRCRAGC